MSSESAADLGQLLTSDAAPILSPVCAEEHLREQLQALQAQLDHLNDLKQKAVEMNNAENIRPPLARVIVASFDLPQAEQAILGQPLEYLESFKQLNDFGDDSSSSHSGDSSTGAGSPREEYLYLMNYLKNSEDFDYVWVGGLDVRKYEVFDIRAIQQHLMDAYNCVPVFGNDQTFDDHYNGFCKAVLWPLLHGIPPVSIYSIADKRTSVEKAWNAFLKVNEAFAQQILQFYNPTTDVIWVHDYHLFLLPFIIRQQLPDAVIGFYLHTCFPSSEIFRILPYRHQILQGILSSDTVFVQTPDDKRHLMTSCMKVLNTTKTEEGVQTENGHFTNIKVNPVGVDLELIEHLNRDISLVKRRDMLLKQTKSHTIIISVDEMDYVKGISHKLSAYEQFLESWPEYRDKVVLVQVVFPVRSESDEYHILQSQVNEQVGRINSKYGTVDYLPIHYVNRHVDKAELLAMFSLAKVCLITPLKDGMNVLPLQFLACQDPKDPGSLILSEFAGCSSVVTEARVINPWATQQFAEAIHAAICEDKAARVERHATLRKCLDDHTTFVWTNEVLSDLLSTLQRSQDNEAFVARNH